MERAGGGVMINQAIHTLDLMHLVGGEINELEDTINNLFDYGNEVEDTAVANIKFKNGARGLFFATIINSAIPYELKVQLLKRENLDKR